MESILSRLATSELSIFYLVSVAEETGLSLALSDIPKTDFVATRSNYSASSCPRQLTILLESISNHVAMGFHGF